MARHSTGSSVKKFESSGSKRTNRTIMIDMPNEDLDRLMEDYKEKSMNDFYTT